LRLARAVLPLGRMRSFWIAVTLLVGFASIANAAPKRVAVLSFEGPSAAKIRGELIKLVQKKHRITSLESWNKTAKTLSATKITPANVKKVARKLGVDAVIEATVIKRRDGFRVRLRLREGTTGRAFDELSLTTTGMRFDKASLRDIRDELIDVISTLDD